MTDPTSGNQVTLTEALESGLLHSSTGELILDSGVRLSLEEAAAQGLIDPRLAEALLSPDCGVPDPEDPEYRRQLTLLQAIDRGLFDLDVDGQQQLQRKVRRDFEEVIKTMTSKSSAPTAPTLAAVLRSGALAPKSGILRHHGRNVALKDALAKGYIRSGQEDTEKTHGISLSDALKMGLVEAKSGKVVDRFSGQCVEISEAIKRGILNPDHLEVFDPKKRYKIGLQDALDINLVDEKTGKYKSTKGEIPLTEALKKNFLYNPLTIKECDDADLLDKEIGQIKDPVTGERLSLLEAVAQGVIDTELKSIRDVSKNELVTLGEAIARGVISTSEKGANFHEGSETIPLAEAVKRGNLTTVAQKSIFDIEGIKDQLSEDYMSFNTALDNATIVKDKIVDKKTGQNLTFSEAADKGLIQSQLLEMLRKKVGIKDSNGKEMNLLEAVTDGKIDPNSGLVIDQGSTIPLEKALQKGLISPMGAAVLKSLLSITVTTATVTETVKRYIKVSSSDAGESGTITFEDAIERGLIDRDSGLFTHPETGKQLLVDEAVNLGLVKMSSSSTVLKSSSVAASELKYSSQRSSVVKGHSSTESSRAGSPDKSTRKDSTASSASRKTSSSSVGSAGSSPSKRLSSPTKSKKNSMDTTFEDKEEYLATREEVLSSYYSATSKTSESVSTASSSRHVPIAVETTKNGSFQAASKQTLPKMSEIDVPFTLKEAIDKQLFDGSKGIFRTAESQLTFKQCLDQGLIDAKSASVVAAEDDEPPVSLQKAFEKGILDECGNFTDGRRTLTMQQAIRTGRVKHVRTIGKKSSSKSSLVSPEDDFIKIHDKVRFRKESGAFEVHPDLTPGDLLQALQEGKLRPFDIMVKNTKKDNPPVNILEAIRSGLINKNSGEYTTEKGRKHNIVDAIKYGYITFMGAPNVSPSAAGIQSFSVEPAGSLRGGAIHARIVQSGVTTTKISSFMVEVPGTGEEVTLDEAVKRGLVTEETAKLYKEEVTTDSKVESTVVLITDPSTGEELPSEEAVARGIVSQEEVEEFIRMKDQQQNITRTSSSTTTRSSSQASSRPRSAGSSTPSPSKARPSSPTKTTPTKETSTSPKGSPVKSERPTQASQNKSASSSPKKVVPKDETMSPPIKKSPSTSPPKEVSAEKKPTSKSLDSENGSPRSSSGSPAKESVISPRPSSSCSRESPAVRVKKQKSTKNGEVSKKTSKSPKKEPIKTPSPKKERPTTLGTRSPTKSGSSRSSSKPGSPIKESPLSRSRSSSLRRRRKESSPSSTSSSEESSKSSSSGTGHDSYRSEMTIEIDRNFDNEELMETMTAHHTVTTKIVNVKAGYALSSLKEVRNLATGETMSIYEAKLRGIASEVGDSKAEQVNQQIKIFVDEAVSKGLVDFCAGTFTNPSNGQSISIGEAIKLGLLITDFRQKEELVQFDVQAPQISLCDAFQNCFDSTNRRFSRHSRGDTNAETLTLEQAVSEDWINGNDIIFDVSSNKQNTLKEALDQGYLDGQTCEYTVLTTKEKHFILDAARDGLVAVFPEPMASPDLELSDVTFSLQETFENGVYNRVSNTFMDVVSQQQITIHQALKIGLIDFRSAEVLNTSTGAKMNLLEAVDSRVIDKKTGMFTDVDKSRELSLAEAFEDNLIFMVEREGSPFECITFWEAIERQQLNTETGMFTSIHEENKKMTLEEAVYRKYIDKKSALVKDTWKRKYCSLSEASRKKILKEGRVMNTTTGKYLSIREAIDFEMIVREIKLVSLIEALDFGMYQPHSGMLRMPGFDREITLREAIEFKLIDHQKTIVKNRKSNRYISTLEALRTGEIDGNTGLYAGALNLLEARSLGLLLTNDAMVTFVAWPGGNSEHGGAFPA